MHELRLIRTSGAKEHDSLLFTRLLSNTIYELRISARTSSGSSVTGKKEIRTTAGMVMWHDPLSLSLYLIHDR